MIFTKISPTSKYGTSWRDWKWGSAKNTHENTLWTHWRNSIVKDFSFVGMILPPSQGHLISSLPYRVYMIKHCSCWITSIVMNQVIQYFSFNTVSMLHGNINNVILTMLYCVTCWYGIDWNKQKTRKSNCSFCVTLPF